MQCFHVYHQSCNFRFILQKITAVLIEHFPTHFSLGDKGVSGMCLEMSTSTSCQGLVCNWNLRKILNDLDCNFLKYYYYIEGDFLNAICLLLLQMSRKQVKIKMHKNFLQKILNYSVIWAKILAALMEFAVCTAMVYTFS